MLSSLESAWDCQGWRIHGSMVARKLLADGGFPCFFWKKKMERFVRYLRAP